MGLTDTPADCVLIKVKLVIANSGADGLEFIDATNVGTTFKPKSLLILPKLYQFQGKLVAVNSSGDALEFIDASSVGTDTDTFAGFY